MNLKLLLFRAFIVVIITFSISDANAQSYITWSQGFGGVTGTFPGGTVAVTQSSGGNQIDFISPGLGDVDLVVWDNQTFSTIGPNSNVPSNTTTFTFSVPVIITQYNMADIDQYPGGWNDSMEFTGVTFTTTSASNCIATVTGAIATTDALPQTEWAKWFTSTTPVTSFTINYVGIPGVTTHAYLGYSMEVMVAGSTNVVTVNSPTICTGSLATVTATNSMPATYSYVWTVPVGVPNPGNVASFTTSVAGNYSVIATNTTTSTASPAASGVVTITSPVTPTFVQKQPICAGEPLSALPLTSTNGITGTWSPALNTMNTTTYTFTPAAGECATPTTMTIVVNPATAPLFSQVAPICTGTTLSALPTISTNGISGSWTPAINSLATTTYTFTPFPNQCAAIATMTITVNPLQVATFTPRAPICVGATLAALSTTSLEGVTGTWSPAMNNTATTTYTFTPTTGQCASPVTLTIVVNPIQNATFDAVAPLCYGETFALPTISTNGLSGSWSPAFNPIATTDYTFTPDANVCATTTNMTITINPDFEFAITESCVNGNFILSIESLNDSFVAANASFEWKLNGNVVGNDSAELNVSQLLQSTAAIETLPLDFNVEVTNSEGCSHDKMHQVTTMFCGIQKGISVNGDGSNDFFDLRLLNVSKLQIFNRYGMEIFSKKNYYNEWRGQMNNGEIVADGVYYYRIDFASGERSKTGWIYVISKS